MFGNSDFSWWTSSKSDPRWNMSGRAYGSFSGSTAIDDAVRAKEKELGEKPPGDLECGGMKD